MELLPQLITITKFIKTEIDSRDINTDYHRKGMELLSEFYFY